VEARGERVASSRDPMPFRPSVLRALFPVTGACARALAFSLLAAGLAACLAGCKGDPPPPPPPAPPPPPPPAILAPRQVTTDAAFDLIATAQGAALVWAPPAVHGGGIRLVRLNAIGGAFGEEAVVHREKTSRSGESLGPSLAIEVSAAAGGGRVVVAWLQRDPMELRIKATHGLSSALEFAPVADWGKTEAVVDARQRSVVAAAAAPDGTMSVLYRSLNSKCKNDAGAEIDCASMHVRRVGTPDFERENRPLLEVPAPCDQPIVGHLWSEGTWYYGICSKDAKGPVTTLYAIQFEPEYALAENILPGRVPFGIAPGGGGAMAVGWSGDSRDSVRFADSGRKRTEVSRMDMSAVCVDGRPALVAKVGDGSTFTLPLTEPSSRIEALLPADIIDQRARAVWTGKAILVAYPSSGEVALRRYECVAGNLERTDL
jgi:hypothetical protein